MSLDIDKVHSLHWQLIPDKRKRPILQPVLFVNYSYPELESFHNWVYWQVEDRSWLSKLELFLTPIFVAVTSGQNHKSCSDRKRQEKVIETITHSGEALKRYFQEIFYFAVVFQGGMCLCSFLMRFYMLFLSHLKGPQLMGLR